MSLVLLFLQAAALAFAGLALALPAYVFVVVVWSSLVTLAAALHHAGADAAGRLARLRLPRFRVAKSAGRAVALN